LRCPRVCGGAVGVIRGRRRAGGPEHGNQAHDVHIISSDLFHLYEAHTPRHSKMYVDLVPIMEKGLSDYRDDVRSRAYPGKEHTVFMKEDELAKFKQLVGKQPRKAGTAD